MIQSDNKSDDTSIEIILKKMVRVIKTSDDRHRYMAERYISLANHRLNDISNSNNVWGVIGASMAIEKQWNAKFGAFVPRSEPV